MRALLFVLVLVGLPVSATTAAQVYLAPLDRAEWVSHRSEVGCHLVHEIPMFGFALLTHRGPAESFLSIYSDNPPLESQNAMLFSRAPHYVRQTAYRDLQHVRVKSDREIFHLNHRTTQRVLSELYDGRMVGLRLDAWWRDGQAEVALSNVGFRTALLEHQACVAAMSETDPAVLHAEREDLVTMGYAAIAFERPDRDPPPVPAPYQIYFPPHDSDLDEGIRDQLHELTDYLLHESAQWEQVSIAAYSEPTGDANYNQMLAEHRAGSIAEYLISQGVERDRVQQEVFLARHARGVTSSEENETRQHQVVVVVRR